MPEAQPLAPTGFRRDLRFRVEFFLNEVAEHLHSPPTGAMAPVTTHMQSPSSGDQPIANLVHSSETLAGCILVVNLLVCLAS